jgi:hypothetical protein
MASRLSLLNLTIRNHSLLEFYSTNGKIFVVFLAIAGAATYGLLQPWNGNLKYASGKPY